MKTSIYTKELDRKDSIRINALKRRNARVYASLCDELGVQPEDIDLYDSGQMELIEDARRDDEVDRKNYWCNLTRIALKRFPELQPGERIGVVEIKRRLRQIRDAGYPVSSYHNMNKNQIWTYLSQIRRDITAKARSYCLKTLEQITRENEQAQRNVWGHR